MFLRQNDEREKTMALLVLLNELKLSWQQRCAEASHSVESKCKFPFCHRSSLWCLNIEVEVNCGSLFCSKFSKLSPFAFSFC